MEFFINMRMKKYNIIDINIPTILLKIIFGITNFEIPHTITMEIHPINTEALSASFLFLYNGLE